MAYRELTMVDVREILRRYQAGQTVRRIARESGTDRKTVRRYIGAARKVGLQSQTPLSDELVHQVAQLVQARPAVESSEQRQALAVHRDQIATWLSDERPLRLTKVRELLRRRGVVISYATLRRFAIDELGWRKRPVTVRLADTAPGEEAQIDFGRMGMMTEAATGKRRTVWALIVTLSFSRHQFVWPTLSQTVEQVCEGLERAWQFFGGMVARIVCDNLKPVVIKADPLSPTLSETFVDYSQARGLFIDAARVRRPQDKARVENQVKYVRDSWFAGEHFDDLEVVRGSARTWCAEIAAQRVHGTTRRVVQEHYDSEERAHMRAAPSELYDVPVWTKAKVHPDHHIQVLKALYSVPTRYVGALVRVRCDSKTVRIYLGTEVIKVHPRQGEGGRSTDADDYPKDKAAYAFRNVDTLLAEASRRGEHVGEYAHCLLSGPLPWRYMRQGYALLRLCEKYGARRVDAVCKRALAFDVIDVHRIKRMLQGAQRVEQDAVERGKLVQLTLPTLRFARDPQSFRTRKDSTEPEGVR